MKTINKILFISVSLVLGVLTSCSEDIPSREDSPVVSEGTVNAFFPKAQSSTFSVGVDATKFTFEYSSIKNPEIKRGTVTKDAAYNFVAYSFTSHGQVNNVEPRKNSYDLCFTQYTHYFNEEKMYYRLKIISGC